jgi:Lipocalin-like domain
MRSIAGVLGLVLVLSVTVAFAGENPVLGTWKLKSFVREVFTTGERYNQLGEHPDGYLSYSADGRMYAFLTSNNRIAPHEVAPTDEERANLYRTMQGYAGTYTMDAEKVIHHVDISWNQAWTGTDQIRFYTLDGNTLTIMTAPNKSPFDGREGRGILVWERIRAPTQ